jgi:hypothetical protein
MTTKVRERTPVHDLPLRRAIATASTGGEDEKRRSGRVEVQDEPWVLY